jgi:hypothetical protein
MALTKIVSGGQAGVDRGALDAALAAQFPCGGWCPDGRKAEDGVIPDRYPLTVLPGAGYRQRTMRNVHDSDGTLIVFDQLLAGGTKLTRDFCLEAKKPFFVVNAFHDSAAASISGVLRFIGEKDIRVLNVAGPRASGWALGHQFAFDILSGVINHGAAQRSEQPAIGHS